MEANRFIKTECQTAVENIKIGEHTMALLKCRAMLTDIHEIVNSVLGEVYNQGADKVGDFAKTYSDLDNELCHLIAKAMEMNSLESNFEEM